MPSPTDPEKAPNNADPKTDAETEELYALSLDMSEYDRKYNHDKHVTGYEISRLPNGLRPEPLMRQCKVYNMSQIENVAGKLAKKPLDSIEKQMLNRLIQSYNALPPIHGGVIRHLAKKDFTHLLKVIKIRQLIRVHLFVKGLLGYHIKDSQYHFSILPLDLINEILTYCPSDFFYPATVNDIRKVVDKAFRDSRPFVFSDEEAFAPVKYNQWQAMVQHNMAKLKDTPIRKKQDDNGDRHRQALPSQGYCYSLPEEYTIYGYLKPERIFQRYSDSFYQVYGHPISSDVPLLSTYCCDKPRLKQRIIEKLRYVLEGDKLIEHQPNLTVKQVLRKKWLREAEKTPKKIAQSHFLSTNPAVNSDDDNEYVDRYLAAQQKHKESQAEEDSVEPKLLTRFSIFSQDTDSDDSSKSNDKASLKASDIPDSPSPVA